MATSRAEKIARRSAEWRAQVREDLADGELPEAIYTAQNAVLAALAKNRRGQPGVAGLIHAEVAATLLALADMIPNKLPLTPPGFEKGQAVQPEDRLAVFDTVLARGDGRA